MSKKMVGLVGASGHLGGLIAETLRDMPGVSLRVLVHTSLPAPADTSAQTHRA